MKMETTVYRFVEDIYDPDGAEMEVAVDVEFHIQRAEPDVGIMSDYAEDVTVIRTDCDQFPVEWAQAWIDGNSGTAEYAMEKIHEAANSYSRDYEYDG